MMNKRVFPSEKTLSQLADVFGIEVADVFGIEVDEFFLE